MDWKEACLALFNQQIDSLERSDSEKIINAFHIIQGVDDKEAVKKF